MDPESARLQARNIYAKHAECSRPEADDVVRGMSTSDCYCLATMSDVDAALAVKRAKLLQAQRLVSEAAKAVDENARQGLSPEAAAEQPPSPPQPVAPEVPPGDVQELKDGATADTGLDAERTDGIATGAAIPPDAEL